MSIAKAGIITTLNARTSILAAANPVGSKYIREWPITRNIDLPPTLISRFDLLYLVLDNVDEVSDRRLAQHLVGLYLEDSPETGGEDILVRLRVVIPSSTIRLTLCSSARRPTLGVHFLRPHKDPPGPDGGSLQGTRSILCRTTQHGY